MLTNLEALQTLYCGEFNGGFITQARSIVNSVPSSSFLSREVGDRAGKFQAFNHGLVVLWPAPNQEATHSAFSALTA